MSVHLVGLRRVLLAIVAAVIGVAAALTACSTNAGFGTPSGNPPPLNPGAYGAATSPLPSGSVVPLGSGAPNEGVPSTASPLETASPIPNTLSIEGASLRVAYDGAAADPAKAPRLLELAFALQNTTKKSAKIADLKLHSDSAAIADQAVAVSAPANQTSRPELVAIRTSDDPLKYKQLKVDFIDDTKKVISSQTLDVSQEDFSFTPLGEKHPKGGVTIDSMEISR